MFEPIPAPNQQRTHAAVLPVCKGTASEVLAPRIEDRLNELVNEHESAAKQAIPKMLEKAKKYFDRTGLNSRIITIGSTRQGLVFEIPAGEDVSAIFRAIPNFTITTSGDVLSISDEKLDEDGSEIKVIGIDKQESELDEDGGVDINTAFVLLPDFYINDTCNENTTFPEKRYVVLQPYDSWSYACDRLIPENVKFYKV